MMFLSVLLSVFLIHNTVCRRLLNDLGNEISTNAVDNLYNDVDRSYLKINNSQSVVTKKYGSRVELYCEAWGSPPPTIQWYKRNMKLTENDPDLMRSQFSFDETTGFAKVASRLVIDYLLPRHNDLYRCVAISGTKEADSVTKIVVTNPSGISEMNFTQLLQSKILGAAHQPRVTYWSQSYMDVMGNDVLLPCKTVGNPKPRLQWFAPSEQEILNDNPRIQVLPDGELRIRDITWEDMGVYTCVVTNIVGQDNTETFLYPLLPDSTIEK